MLTVNKVGNPRLKMAEMVSRLLHRGSKCKK